MKTKVLNFVMPVFVFIMAIGLAFATEKVDDQTGFYYDPGLDDVIEVSVDCDSSDIEQCEVDGNPVFAERSLDTPILKTMKP